MRSLEQGLDRARLRTDRSPQWQAQRSVSDNDPAPANRSLEQIAARCRTRVLTFDDEHRTEQERFLDFGPRWRCLKSLALGENEALAQLELAARTRGRSGRLPVASGTFGSRDRLGAVPDRRLRSCRVRSTSPSPTSGPSSTARCRQNSSATSARDSIKRPSAKWPRSTSRCSTLTAKCLSTSRDSRCGPIVAM